MQLKPRQGPGWLTSSSKSSTLTVARFRHNSSPWSQPSVSPRPPEHTRTHHRGGTPFLPLALRQWVRLPPSPGAGLVGSPGGSGVQQTHSSMCMHSKPLVLMILSDDNCEEVSPDLKMLAPEHIIYFHSHCSLYRKPSSHHFTEYLLRLKRCARYFTYEVTTHYPISSSH